MDDNCYNMVQKSITTLQNKLTRYNVLHKVLQKLPMNNSKSFHFSIQLDLDEKNSLQLRFYSEFTYIITIKQ